MKSLFYERLFQLNRCLEQVVEILEQFRQDELIHAVFANDRQQTVEDLRADLSHVLTGMLHQKELEASVALTRKQIESEKPSHGEE
jgi:truncated hemoglobin YjbI